MHAKDAEQDTNGRDAVESGAEPTRRRPRAPWIGLLLAAVLAGALTGTAGRFASTEAEALLRTRVERGLDDASALLRLARTAGALATAVTQAEQVTTAARRQAVHPALNQRSDQLGEALNALAHGGAETRERLGVLRASVVAMRGELEELNQIMDRRVAVERDLGAALDRIAPRLEAFAATVSVLPHDDTRHAIEERGRSLGAHLLAAGTSAGMAHSARAAFRATADALLDALDALPIDPSSPRRAEAARQLVALGLDGGNLFDLRQEQERLATAAAHVATSLRQRAEDIAAQAEGAAAALRDTVLADRDRALAGLVLGPAGSGLLAALAVFAVGSGALWLARRPAEGASRRKDAPQQLSHAAQTIPDQIIPDQIIPSRTTPDRTMTFDALDDLTADPADDVPPLHILLAEDEPVNQMAITAILRRAGHTVTVVDTGRAALEAVQGDRYDLTLMDLRMPGMDGIEATRRIRALPDQSRARQRIVMLTASAVPGDRERCLNAGADAVLEKPLRLDALQPVLERLYAIDTPASAPVIPHNAHARPFDDSAIAQMREHLPAERVAALIRGTARTLRQYHTTLAEAWTAGDTATVSAMAHKIAGVAGLYGCVALRQVAQALERAVETGDGDPAALRGQLDTAVPPALAALEAQLAGV